MPTFGDYETVGEPVAVANESGHVTTLWRARKNGTTTGGEFAVKVYAPHRQSAPGLSGDALDRDRGLEFLEGIKQIKKAQAEGARCLAPVHALGTSDDGAWYVTDFFQRGSLAAWINRRVNVDSAALGQIVACLVSGCLDLKRSRGNSHGNLKTTNVFLVGPTRPLRKTPLALADAHPAAPMKLAALEGEDRRTTDELLQQVMEAQDLRAIGEIILQLVEGRLVSNAYDYNYPVPRSAVWNLLGKDGERWRELCNQLLNPQLSLEEINLETLAKKYALGGGGGKGLVIAAVLLLVLGLAGGGAYGFMKWNEQRNGAQFEQDLRAAGEAFAQTNLISAWDKITAALNKKPEDKAALTLKADIEKRNGEESQLVVSAAAQLISAKRYPDASSRLDWAGSHLRPSEALSTSARDLRNNLQTEQDYGAAMDAGQKKLTDGDYEGAIAQADAALKLKSKDKDASTLRDNAQSKLNNRSAAQRQQNYEVAMEAGRAAYKAEKYAEAIKQADLALQASRPDDAGALKLKRDAKNAKDEADRQAEGEVQYAEAMADGHTALAATNYQKAVDRADLALSYKPGDAAAKKLRENALKAKGETAAQAEQSRKYQVAMEEGQRSFNLKDYTETIKQAEAALAIRTKDPAATKLKSDAKARQAEMAEQLQQERSYQVAMTDGQKALDKKNYPEALRQAGLALAIKPTDAAATKLQDDAKARQAEMDAQFKQDQDYRAAMEAGQKAYDLKDYAGAITQAEAALAILSGDAEAKKLKAKAQADLGKLEALALQNQNYKAAMTAADAALAAKDYAGAIKQADAALAIKTGDGDATKLKSVAATRQAEIAEQALRDQNYQTAMGDGRKAFGANNYDEAVKQARLAQENKPGDTLAMQLEKDARAEIARIEGEKNKAIQYQKAMTSANSAFGRKDYAGAITQADAALAIKPQDSDATTLKTSAQGKLKEEKQRKDRIDELDTQLLVLLRQLSIKPPKWLLDEKLAEPPAAAPVKYLRGTMPMEAADDYIKKARDLKQLYGQVQMVDQPADKTRRRILDDVEQAAKSW